MKRRTYRHGIVGLAAVVTLLFAAQAAHAALADEYWARPDPQIMGDIDGMVMKVTGDGISGARVQLINGAGRVVDGTRTDKDGHFHFDNVRRGKYWLYTTYGPAEHKQIIAMEGASGMRITVVLEG